MRRPCCSRVLCVMILKQTRPLFAITFHFWGIFVFVLSSSQTAAEAEAGRRMSVRAPTNGLDLLKDLIWASCGYHLRTRFC
jgi:hypothetical protein